jgi:K(+)-stimulated pyrophosphate-energized sodium pump
LTGFFAEIGRRPVNDAWLPPIPILATVLLAGIAVGFESAVYSTLDCCRGIPAITFILSVQVRSSSSLFAICTRWGCYQLAVGVIVAMDADSRFRIMRKASLKCRAMCREKRRTDPLLNWIDWKHDQAIAGRFTIATAVLAATALSFGAQHVQFTSC